MLVVVAVRRSQEEMVYPLVEVEQVEPEQIQILMDPQPQYLSQVAEEAEDVKVPDQLVHVERAVQDQAHLLQRVLE